MNESVGISGFSLFVPPYRVQLRDWCTWTGNSWDKTRAVIGNSFRVVGPDHSVYTMAANAALRLIEDYAIDPQSIGYLAVGTESGTDNATSAAVVVRGLIDEALRASGKQPLARDIEAPEFKQACLGGVYGIKGALRYLAVDGANRKAIVIAGDIAEYSRGSTGEATQGAGAVAMLLEHSPKIMEIDVRKAGSATSYRAVDFRKPFLRFCSQTVLDDGRPRDFPIFNGKYSTACYIDETLCSLSAFFGRQSTNRLQYIRNLAAVFMHRPYHRMPVAAWTYAYLFALGADKDQGLDELGRLAQEAGVSLQDVLNEMSVSPDLLGRALQGDLAEEAYPLTAQLIKPLRKTAAYSDVIEGKLKLGASVAMELGNLYCGALPAWVAAGLHEAAAHPESLASKEILMIGYGSGDASEAIAATLVAGWDRAAARINIDAALAGAIDLTQSQYEALHDGKQVADLPLGAAKGFCIQKIGRETGADFQDFGVEYYRLKA
ncbi:MAG TPA: hypothetical protein VFS47_10415 [Steroidobacteraceae bacterium]|nr:hypothetical protein [Steroidobacteraceae bacterium]